MKPDTRSFYELCVRRAVERIVVALDEALDLEALAREAALSPLHFHRIFRGMVGETPLDLHRRLRLERAARALLEEDIPVTSVAFGAGYETHESFTRAFRAHYCRSPSEFRQGRHRDAPECKSPFQIELAARSGLHFGSEPCDIIIAGFIEGESIMDVQIKDMKELRVATVRHIGPYNQISEAFTRLGALAASANLFGPEAAMIAIYHDDPQTKPEAELRSDAAVAISAEAKVPAGMGEIKLPAGRYATTTHIGPYEQLGDAWARFMGEWLPHSEHRLRDGGLSFEIYRNTPNEVPKDQLRTELYMPLA
jgi:AraC family transcriptional regulator